MEYLHQKGGPLLARPAEGDHPASPGSSGGGVMRIGRAFIIPAILTLGVAGSALVGAAIPVAAANTPIVTVHSSGLTVGTNMYHHS